MYLALAALGLLGCVAAVRIAVLLCTRRPARPSLVSQIGGIVAGTMIGLPALLLMCLFVFPMILPALVCRRRLDWALVSAVYYPLFWWCAVMHFGLGWVITTLYLGFGLLSSARHDPRGRALNRRWARLLEGRRPDGKFANG
jgi:hypothetical protein